VYENAKEIEIFYGASLNIAVLLWKQILKEWKILHWQQSNKLSKKYRNHITLSG
jgi:hypothetical protein